MDGFFRIRGMEGFPPIVLGPQGGESKFGIFPVFDRSDDVGCQQGRAGRADLLERVVNGMAGRVLLLPLAGLAIDRLGVYFLARRRIRVLQGWRLQALDGFTGRAVLFKIYLAA